MAIGNLAITLVLATRRDLPLVRRWLVQSDIARVWGSPVQNVREMRLILGAPERDARLYLILDKTQNPIGLISLLHARLIAGVFHDWPAHLPIDGWEIGILIAHRKNRRLGIGSTALKRVHEDLPGRPDEPVFAYILPGNKGSLRTFEKLGYCQVARPQNLPGGWSVLRYDRSEQ